MSLSDGSLCCYKERGCHPGWGFSGGTPGSSGRVSSSARSQDAPPGGFAVRRKGTDLFAKGHGFIRAMRCGRNSFLVAFRPCLVPQRLKPAKGASRLDNIGTGLSRVVAGRLPMEIIGTGSVVPFHKWRPDLRGAHLARPAVDLSRRSLSGCATRAPLISKSAALLCP
jgi:hypothetical protein